MLSFSKLTKERIYTALMFAKNSFFNEETGIFEPNNNWMQMVATPGQGKLGDKFVIFNLPVINDLVLSVSNNAKVLTDAVYKDPEIDVPLLNSFVTSEGYYKYKNIADDIVNAYESPERHTGMKHEIIREFNFNSIADFLNPWKPFQGENNIVSPLMWCNWTQLKNWKRTVDLLNQKLRYSQGGY